jgi:hypothetical protein
MYTIIGQRQFLLWQANVFSGELITVPASFFSYFASRRSSETPSHLYWVGGALGAVTLASASFAVVTLASVIFVFLRSTFVGSSAIFLSSLMVS